MPDFIFEPDHVFESTFRAYLEDTDDSEREKAMSLVWSPEFARTKDYFTIINNEKSARGVKIEESPEELARYDMKQRLFDVLQNRVRTVLYEQGETKFFEYLEDVAASLGRFRVNPNAGLSYFEHFERNDFFDNVVLPLVKEKMELEFLKYNKSDEASQQRFFEFLTQHIISTDKLRRQLGSVGITKGDMKSGLYETLIDPILEKIFFATIEKEFLKLGNNKYFFAFLQKQKSWVEKQCPILLKRYEEKISDFTQDLLERYPNRGPHPVFGVTPEDVYIDSRPKGILKKTETSLVSDNKSMKKQVRFNVKEEKNILVRGYEYLKSFFISSNPAPVQIEKKTVTLLPLVTHSQEPMAEVQASSLIHALDHTIEEKHQHQEENLLIKTHEQALMEEAERGERNVDIQNAVVSSEGMGPGDVVKVC